MKPSKNQRKKEQKPRSPRGHLSATIRPSSQKESPGQIRINIPATLRHERKQDYFSLGLPATPKNLIDVYAALEKIDARVNILQELNLLDMSKEELKNHILSQLGQPNEELKSKPNVEIDRLLIDYIEHARSILKRSLGTLSIYLTVYNSIKNLSTKNLSDYTNIIAELANLEESAYHRALQKLSVCCDWAVEEDRIRKNPFKSTLKALKSPRETDKHPDPFSWQAAEQIIKAYRNHSRYQNYAKLIEFLFKTGLRTGEAVGLIWSNIELEKGIIHIRKTMSLVRGKHTLRHQTKTGKNRDFPIEDPIVEKILRELWTPNKKGTDYVFQELNGSHVDRNRLYYSWYGSRNNNSSEDGTKKEYFSPGIVSKLASLPEDQGGIDHYRPLYNTRHTFITFVLGRMVQLNEFTMKDVVQLSEYTGHDPEVLFEHYLGRSGNRKLVNTSLLYEEAEALNAANVNHLSSTIHQQVIELEQHNSRLQATLQSLVEFIATLTSQFVPELQRSSVLTFVKTLVPNYISGSISARTAPAPSSDEMTECAAWIASETNFDN